MQIQGYFQPPQAPAAKPAPAASRAYQGASLTLGTDTYRGGSASVGITNVAPAVPGIAAGIHGYEGVKGAKWGYYKASRSHSYAKKVAAPGIAGQSITANLLGAVRNSVLFGALISIGLNGYGVAKGELKVAEAGANVVGDTATAAVGGAAGCAASMLGTWALIGPLGSGLALNMIGIGLGIGGYLAAEHFFRQSDLYATIREKAHALFGRVAG